MRNVNPGDGTTSLQVNACPITIYPELVAAAMKNKELDIYICWCILRALDIQRGGSGHYSVAAMGYIAHIALGIGTTQMYAKIKKGEGKYWTSPKGQKGKRSSSLISISKVINYLQPTMTRTEPLVCRIGDLIPGGETRNWPTLRNFLVSVVAARHVRPRPVTRATIEEQTGLSRSTVFRRLSQGAETHLRVVKNCAKIHAGDTYAKAKDALAQILATEGGANPWRIVKIEGHFFLVKQIANSYMLPEFTRVPLSKRPPALRALDIQNALVCDQPRYCVKETKLNNAPSQEKVWYSPDGNVKIRRLGKVGLWKSTGDTEIIVNSTTRPRRSQVVSRWHYFSQWHLCPTRKSYEVEP